MDRFTGLLGLVAVMAVAYLFSSDRRAIQPASSTGDSACKSALPFWC